MSVYLPLCNWDGHFWPKKKCLFYLAIGGGAEFKRYRLRFCPDHGALVDEHLSQYELTVVQYAARASNGHMTHCFSGGEPLAEIVRQVFITGYPTQDQRKDYWFQVCGDHGLPEYLTNSYSP